MNLDKDRLRRLLAKSRAEFVRLLWEANDVADAKDSAGRALTPEDRRTARALWDAAYEKERSELFPPFEIPPFDFPNQEGRTAPELSANDEVRKSRVRSLRDRGFAIQSFSRMAAALLLIALGAVVALVIENADFSPAGVRVATLEKEIVTPASLSDGRLLIGHARVEAQQGTVDISRGMAFVEWKPTRQIFTTYQMNGAFDLSEPLQLEVRHPLLTIRVTGTRFDLNVSRNSGTLELYEGSLELLHRPAGQSPSSTKTRVLRSPAKLVFDAQKAVSIPVSSGPRQIDEPRFGFPDDVTVQRFRLSDGRTVVGFVIRGTADELIVQTESGEQRRVAKSDLVSSENVR